uniref:VWFA domain-containing protein n=1 Tax=Panagrellus redivivus TaxID=6233 RepID=A0A7E4W4T6_PANRE
MLRFLIVFGLLISTGNAANHLCEQIDVIFVVESTSNISADYFKKTVQPFVKKFAESFNFVDDNKNAHARFGFGLYGDQYHYQVGLLTDETRHQFEKRLTSKLNYVDRGVGDLVNGLGVAEMIVKTSGYNQNRVVVVLSSNAKITDATSPTTRYLQDMCPAIFGVGIPNSDNVNSVASHPTAMIQIALNRSDYVYSDLTAAQDPTNGIISKIKNVFPCGTAQCVGYIFALELTEKTKPFLSLFVENVKKFVTELPFANHGFMLLVTDSKTTHDYNFEAAEGVIDHLNTLNDAEFVETGPPDLEGLIMTIRVQIENADFHNYAIFMMSETDQVINQDVVDFQAGRIASSTPHVYVLDVSETPTDKLAFLNLVNNDTSKIINGVGKTTDEVYALLEKGMVKEFSAITC